MKPWNTPARVLLTSSVVLFICFIFFNSSLSAQQSSAVSEGAVEQINALLRQLCLPWEITDHVVRKTAHFIEFMGLGLLLFLTIRSHSAYPARHLFPGLFLGLAVPVADESLQLFVEGRSAQVSDILLDFSGFATGTLVFFVIFFLVTRKKRRTLTWKHLASS